MDCFNRFILKLLITGSLKAYMLTKSGLEFNQQNKTVGTSSDARPWPIVSTLAAAKKKIHGQASTSFDGHASWGSFFFLIILKIWFRSTPSKGLMSLAVLPEASQPTESLMQNIHGFSAQQKVDVVLSVHGEFMVGAGWRWKRSWNFLVTGITPPKNSDDSGKFQPFESMYLL